MKKAPLVSVVMPTYNHGRFIGAALESVLAQTFNGVEVLVIDNYSADDTEGVVASFRDRRVVYTKFRNNGVIAASRNLGIRLSRGKYIAFLDSDDVWYPRKVESAIKAFRKNPEAILVCHDEKITVDGRHHKTARYGPYDEDMYYRLLFHRNRLSTSATVIKAWVARKTGGFSERTDFIGCEDYEYWLRLAREGRFVFLREVLGEYRVHGRNFISNPSRHARNALNVIEHHYRGLTAEEKKRFRAQLALRRARTAASCFKRLCLDFDAKAVGWGARAVAELGWCALWAYGKGLLEK